MTVQITERIYPQTRTIWRSWLSKNHNSKKEIWVTYYKKHTGKPSLIYEEAVEEALCFGWIDGIEKRLDDESFAQRFTPRTTKSNWSAPNIARYHKLVQQKRMTHAGTEAFERRKTV